jgi:hypothetical protein
MTTEAEARIVKLIDDAAEFQAENTAHADKPILEVDRVNPDQTVAQLRDIIASSEALYDRGGPCQIVQDRHHGGHVVRQLTADGVIRYAHSVCRPMKWTKDGEFVPAALPKSIATMYLDWYGAWDLPPLSGIGSTPLLRGDGSIQFEPGYDVVTGIFLEDVPDVAAQLPETPSRTDAEAALRTLRSPFATFCFADAKVIETGDDDGLRVDLDRPPGRDESALLTALMTAICRPSLDLAPAILIRAALLSGAGSGKGLLGRCICALAFGRDPHAVTVGDNRQEFEKRIAAELMAGGPTIFLDNLNNMTVRSSQLASAITERPARIRVLGKSEMLPVNATALIIVTGNGVMLSEDLVRRFIIIELDARTEHPESRRFNRDPLQFIRDNRAALLAAGLTVWRWGRQQSQLDPGRPLGSFDQWCSWVRDPLLALGCQDVVERINDAKMDDNDRQELFEIFTAWWQRHGANPVRASEVDAGIQAMLDPQKRGRQFVAARLGKLAGTRLGGFVLTKQTSPGAWGVATYALMKSE